MEWDDIFGYYTPKVVWVRNRNLGCLRLVLVLAIVIYIIYGVIILKHQYNFVETPLGTVEVSLQAPTTLVDPACYRYCTQYAGNSSGTCGTNRGSAATNTTNNNNSTNNTAVSINDLLALAGNSTNSTSNDTAAPSSSSSPSNNTSPTPLRVNTTGNFMVDGQRVYTRRPCWAMHALEVLYPFEDTGGMFISSRITHQINNRVCSLTQACLRPFQQVGPNVTGFVADIESFTLRIRHSMIAVHLFSQHHSTKYAGNSDTMVGRLHRANGAVVKTITSDIFTLKELLDAADTALDEESDTPGNANTSMRDAGIILLITYEYSNENTTMPEYEMTVSRVAYSEYKVSRLERLNDTAVDIVGLHGVKIIFQQTGRIVRFDFQVLLISIVTSAALLAAATSVVEFVMLKVSPLRALYAGAKFERTMEIHEFEDLRLILKKQPALKRIKGERMLTLSQFAFRQYQDMDRKPDCSKEEIAAIARSIHVFRHEQEQREEEERLRLAELKKKAGCCSWCFPNKNTPEQGEEGVQLTDKQFVRSQHEKVFQLLAQGQDTISKAQMELLLAVAGADSASKQLLAENGFHGDLTHDQFIEVLTLLGQLEKVKIGAGVPCVSLFSDEDALDRLFDKLAAQMHASPILPPISPLSATPPLTPHDESLPPEHEAPASRGCRLS